MGFNDETANTLLGAVMILVWMIGITYVLFRIG